MISNARSTEMVLTRGLYVVTKESSTREFWKTGFAVMFLVIIKRKNQRRG